MKKVELLCLFIIFLCVGYGQKNKQPSIVTAPIESSGSNSQNLQQPGIRHLVNPSILKAKDVQSTWTVNVNGGADFTSLQDAIDDERVKDGDVLKLKSGVVNDGYETWGVYINKSLEIIGDEVNQVSIDAANNLGVSDRRCLSVAEGVTVTLRNLVLRNGNLTNTDYHGGGLHSNGTLKMYNVRVMSNKVTSAGGGISNEGTLECYDCVIDDNSAKWGGGVYNWGTYTQTLLDGVQINYNTAEYGGGLQTQQGETAYVRNCSFIGNSASSQGGAINSTRGSSYEIQNSVFQNNTATAGWGGAINSFGTSLIKGSKFFENSAQKSGGAICNNTSMEIQRSSVFGNETELNQGAGIVNFGAMRLRRVTISGNTGYSAGLSTTSSESDATTDLIGCTISNNSDDEVSGVGVYSFSGNASIYAWNTIIAKNKGGGVDIEKDNGFFVSNGNNILGTSDTVLYGLESDMFGVDPQLYDLTQRSEKSPHHKLLLNSPAINAIYPDSENKILADGGDQLGAEAVGLNDIGAVESDYETHQTTVWSEYSNYNPTSDELYNLVINGPAEAFYPDTVNNLYVGSNAEFNVIYPIWVKDQYYNYRGGRGLVLYEDVEFKSNNFQITMPILSSVEAIQKNATTVEVSVKFNPANQIDTIEFEYGEWESYLGDNVIKTNLLIAGVNEQSSTFQVNLPSAAGWYYRLRFVNGIYSFVTNPRVIGEPIVEGVDAEKSSSGFIFYPNPVSDKLNISVKSDLEPNSKLKIVNVVGQKVAEFDINQLNQMIDISQLKSGVYWISIETEKEVFTQKMAVR